MNEESEESEDEDFDAKEFELIIRIVEFLTTLSN